MDIQNKEPDWLDFTLFLLTIGFGVYGIYNIQYDVLHTITYLLLASLTYALMMACDEDTLKWFSKWELIKIALFKNVILLIILFVGVFYNSYVDNNKLCVKFMSAMFFYFILMLVAGTCEEDGILGAIGSLFFFIVVLCIFFGGAALFPFAFFLTP